MADQSSSQQWLAKFGSTLSAILLGLVGAAQAYLQVFPTPGTDRLSKMLYAIAMVIVGFAVASHQAKSNNTAQMLVSSEAEKRIHDPGLPASSVVPAIASEIKKQEAVSGTTK